MLSIIVLSYNSSRKLEGVCAAIDVLLKKEKIPYEVVIVDDGSSDGSYDKALQIGMSNPEVRAYRLSRNFGAFNAVFAGLTLVKGKCATVVPDDQQLPYGTVVEMYRLWEKGNKVIIPHRVSRHDGFLSETSAWFFYRLLNQFTDVRFPDGGADSFLIDREIIDILNNKVNPLDTSLIAEILRLGFDPVYVPYERARSAFGKSRWNLRKKIRYFMHTLFSGSVWPLRIFIVAGIFLAFIGAVLFAGVLTFLAGTDFVIETGHGPVLIISTLIISTGTVLFSLGIMGEYIWKIYKNLQGRQGYIIRKKDE